MENLVVYRRLILTWTLQKCRGLYCPGGRYGLTVDCCESSNETSVSVNGRKYFGYIMARAVRDFDISLVFR